MSYRSLARSNGGVGTVEDPPTMISGTSGNADDEKKKKTKKKLTKAEKAQAKLEKAADDLRRSGPKFEYFLDRMETWIKKHSDKLTELCKSLDVESEGAITYDEFKACLFDLGSPCTKVETQLLVMLLDPNEQEAVEYVNIRNALKYVRDRELTYEHADYRPTLQPTQRKFDHCPTCKLSIWDGVSEAHPRYVMLDLRLVTFDGTKEHPGHVKLLTHTHISIKGIMDYIRQETALQSTKLAIFRDKSRSNSAMLLPHRTLEELGFTGGPVHEPELGLLYYDYVVEFTECPLLMCDYYF